MKKYNEEITTSGWRRVTKWPTEEYKEIFLWLFEEDNLLYWLGQVDLKKFTGIIALKKEVIMSVVCAVCSTSLNPDKEIMCGVSVQSLTCSGLSCTEIQYSSSKDKRLTFNCAACVNKKHDLNALFEFINSLRKDIEELKQQINHNSTSCNNLYEKEELFTELAKRHRRSTNVIIFNIEESTSVNPAQKVEDDNGKVKDIISKLSNVRVDDTKHLVWGV
ncbi:hypothetical protein FQA39_LY00202 [Lamprigera yunnana]|nr:hypothetical protein FQA39_LY00202 [Lamprigera yunnana]